MIVKKKGKTPDPNPQKFQKLLEEAHALGGLTALASLFCLPSDQKPTAESEFYFVAEA